MCDIVCMFIFKELLLTSIIIYLFNLIVLLNGRKEGRKEGRQKTSAVIEKPVCCAVLMLLL